MRSITGLMVKDCLQLKDFSIPLVFWTGVFIALTIVFNLTSLIAILTPFGFGMMVVFAFIFDEMTNAERYLASLPFTRNEIVLSKYILSLITICIGAVVGDILNIIVQLISVGRVEQLSRSLSIGRRSWYFYNGNLQFYSNPMCFEKRCRKKQTDSVYDSRNYRSNMHGYL